MRKAYQYSFNKVNAMEHGRDMTDAAMEQLGLPYNKEETISSFLRALLDGILFKPLILSSIPLTEHISARDLNSVSDSPGE